eukprot:269097-Chlamydomonas_euryale.AAC.7
MPPNASRANPPPVHAPKAHCTSSLPHRPPAAQTSRPQSAPSCTPQAAKPTPWPHTSSSKPLDHHTCVLSSGPDSSRRATPSPPGQLRTPL